MSKLLIVESPSKAKTINKYLGNDFNVLASYGHIRDLLPKTGAIDTDSFEMEYALIDRNKKYLDAIISAAKKSSEIYLATDPDREGEAISWHIVEVLKTKKITADKKLIKRVIFEEITKDAIKEAISKPRDVSMGLVNAQQARRALDYLVGFNLSPLLWKKIRRGLSAGRVQSPALRLICEREAEIEKFQSQEYWSIHLDAEKKKSKFTSKLIQLDDKKVEQFTITSESENEKVVGQLLLKSSGKCRVARVDKKKRSRNPAPPFTTSTMQQEAVRKLGFTTSRTMRIAQQLYEGVQMADGTGGLITYMRTDSFSLSREALGQIRGFIQSNYDSSYLPANSIGYRTKSKNAQEAHEAIRPTDAQRTPSSVKKFLTPEQYKLYEIIWKRSIACQMTPAQFDAVSIDLEIGKGESIFRANGQTLKFPGFMAVYIEGSDDNSNSDKDDDRKIPELEVGEEIPINKIYGGQHFTEPPPRFSEASLVKSLEEFGIGRPSTYASIISTLQDREYVILDRKRFTPTDVGKVVNKFLTEHFFKYVDYEFTANLESNLDDIAADSKEWKPVLKDFWKDFNQQINEKEDIDRASITQEDINESCPKCSQPLFSRLGRRGNFIGCSGYPECDYTRNINEEDGTNEPQVIFHDDNLDKDIFLLRGPYGPYLQIGMPEDEDKKKPKRISVPPNIPIHSVNEDVAKQLLSLPISFGDYPETGKPMVANIGRFGPYVSHDGKFKSIPKSDNIFEISSDRVIELVAELIEKNKPLRVVGEDSVTKETIEVLKGRWGPYLQRGKIKAPLSQKFDYEKINIDEAMEIVNSKVEREKKSKKKKK
jgi:DNA topoisomerase-1